MRKLVVAWVLLSLLGLAPATASVVGDPAQDRTWLVRQSDAFSRVIAVETMILNRLAGRRQFTEESLKPQALLNGYSPQQGTPESVGGQLLETHGCVVERAPHSSLSELAQRLASGYEAMVYVNNGRLWGQASGGGADHAVWVGGAELSDNGEVVAVFVQDSGSGMTLRVGAEKFRQAWSGYAVFARK